MKTSYAAVVGIDFGTGGYAIAIGYKRSSSSCYVVEHSTKNGTYRKNSVAVMARRDGPDTLTLHRLGQDALIDFADLEEDQHEDFLLFPSAKMDLYNPESKLETTSLDGVKAPAADIIELALKEIHTQAVAKLSKTSGVGNMANILWVLTVPAIWSESSKQIMRNAAIKAGIPDKNLVLALEPEAGSMSCRMQGMNDDEVPSPMSIEDSYMVVDAGTGTVDITVHGIGEDGKLNDIIIPQGGPWGSASIDQQFIALLEKVFTPETVNEFRRKFASDWLELKQKFEHLKCRSDLITNKTTRRISLGPKFLFLANQDEDADIYSNLPPGISIDDRYGYLMMSADVVDDLFNPVLKQISAKISKILKMEAVRESCKTIYLVGGFGSCPYLKDAIEKVIEVCNLPQIQLLQPLDPATAVVRGAVLYGHFPDALSSRMCRNTIGIAVTVPYNESEHAKYPYIELDGKKWCTEALDVLVRCGESVKSNQVIRRSYPPAKADQSVSVVRMYQSTKAEEHYTTDYGVQPVGELIVVMPEERTGTEIHVELRFGSTQIQASASTGAGSPVACKLNFSGSELVQVSPKKSMVAVDVCFVMDCTGSMELWIDAAKTHLLGIADSVSKKLTKSEEICDFRASFVAYRDFFDLESERLAIMDFTSDLESVRDFIKQQKAHGGGDGPEDLLGGLNAAATLNWRAQSNRFLILVADSPCHGEAYSGPNSGDDYPEGNPDGLTAEDVFHRLRGLHLQIMFTRITNFTDLMISKFKNLHPIRDIDMSQTECVSQFGKTLSSEIVGHIKMRPAGSNSLL